MTHRLTCTCCGADLPPLAFPARLMGPDYRPTCDGCTGPGPKEI